MLLRCRWGQEESTSKEQTRSTEESWVASFTSSADSLWLLHRTGNGQIQKAKEKGNCYFHEFSNDLYYFLIAI